jgi:DNA-binding transcriptional regulator YhcF (GntR family)
MDFKETLPIYIQITDWACEQILMGEWQSEDRAPSVRELGALLEVNPNTVARAYEFLDQKAIFSNKRGVGFFIAPDGADKVRDFRKERFFEEELPVVFKTMRLLGIRMEEIVGRFQEG